MPLLDKHRIVSVPDSCGGTLTAASITGLTPARFEAMASTEYNLARVIAESLEARAVGVVPRALHELLSSRIKEVHKDEIQKKKVGRQSIIMPFTYRRRKTNVSSDYFRITAGVVNPNANTTVGGIAYPNSSWDITVTAATPSQFASALTNVERYFLPGQYLFIESKDTGASAGSQTAYSTAHKIINAVNVSSTTAKITIAANYTSAGWTALTTPQKAVFQPTFGVVQIGTNNVNDKEAWCYNEVAENVNSLIVDWHQTSRYTQCYNDEYARILKEITSGKVNEFLSTFQHLPLAEQNRKQRLQYEKKWMNSIFYGQRINELQDPATFEQLPQVTDPDDGTVYEYKAGALGLRTLLAAEGRVIDAQGGPLNLDLLFQLAWELKQYRETDGSNVEVIDFMTDKDTANIIDIVLLKYLRDTFGYSVTQFYKPGEIRDASGTVRFSYKQYDIPTIGAKIAIFVDSYFTDRAMQFGDGSGGNNGSANIKSRGNSIWAIDWSDFDIGLIGTNSATREYRGEAMANVNSLFSCVITPNAKHYDLRSQTHTTRLGDAKRSLVIENYNLTTCPTLTLSPCVTV